LSFCNTGQQFLVPSLYLCAGYVASGRGVRNIPRMR
jgi:hypothetical protein